MDPKITLYLTPGKPVATFLEAQDAQLGSEDSFVDGDANIDLTTGVTTTLPANGETIFHTYTIDLNTTEGKKLADAFLQKYPNGFKLDKYVSFFNNESLHTIASIRAKATKDESYLKGLEAALKEGSRGLIPEPLPDLDTYRLTALMVNNYGIIVEKEVDARNETELQKALSAWINTDGLYPLDYRSLRSYIQEQTQDGNYSKANFVTSQVSVNLTRDETGAPVTLPDGSSGIKEVKREFVFKAVPQFETVFYDPENQTLKDYKEFPFLLNAEQSKLFNDVLSVLFSKKIPSVLESVNGGKRQLRLQLSEPQIQKITKALSDAKAGKNTKEALIAAEFLDSIPGKQEEFEEALTGLNAFSMGKAIGSFFNHNPISASVLSSAFALTMSQVAMQFIRATAAGANLEATINDKKKKAEARKLAKMPLDEFMEEIGATDMVEKAATNPRFGRPKASRDLEVAETFKNWLRVGKKFALHTGPAGSGKSEVARAVARHILLRRRIMAHEAELRKQNLLGANARLVRDAFVNRAHPLYAHTRTPDGKRLEWSICPEELAHTRMFDITFMGMLKNCIYVGMAEARAERLLKFVENMITFHPNIDDMFDGLQEKPGSQESATTKMAKSWKPAMADGRWRGSGSMTNEDYVKLVNQDGGQLARRMNPIMLRLLGDADLLGVPSDIAASQLDPTRFETPADSDELRKAMDREKLKGISVTGTRVIGTETLTWWQRLKTGQTRFTSLNAVSETVDGVYRWSARNGKKALEGVGILKRKLNASQAILAGVELPPPTLSLVDALSYDEFRNVEARHEELNRLKDIAEEHTASLRTTGAPADEIRAAVAAEEKAKSNLQAAFDRHLATQLFDEPLARLIIEKSSAFAGSNPDRIVSLTEYIIASVQYKLSMGELPPNCYQTRPDGKIRLKIRSSLIETLINEYPDLRVIMRKYDMMAEIDGLSKDFAIDKSRLGFSDAIFEMIPGEDPAERILRIDTLTSAVKDFVARRKSNRIPDTDLQAEVDKVKAQFDRKGKSADLVERETIADATDQAELANKGLGLNPSEKASDYVERLTKAAATKVGLSPAQVSRIAVEAGSTLVDIAPVVADIALNGIEADAATGALGQFDDGTTKIAYRSALEVLLGEQEAQLAKMPSRTPEEIGARTRFSGEVDKLRATLMKEPMHHVTEKVAASGRVITDLTPTPDTSSLQGLRGSLLQSAAANTGLSAASLDTLFNISFGSLPEHQIRHPGLIAEFIIDPFGFESWSNQNNTKFEYWRRNLINVEAQLTAERGAAGTTSERAAEITQDLRKIAQLRGRAASPPATKSKATTTARANPRSVPTLSWGASRGTTGAIPLKMGYAAPASATASARGSGAYGGFDADGPAANGGFRVLHQVNGEDIVVSDAEPMRQASEQASEQDETPSPKKANTLQHERAKGQVLDFRGRVGGTASQTPAAGAGDGGELIDFPGMTSDVADAPDLSIDRAGASPAADTTVSLQTPSIDPVGADPRVRPGPTRGSVPTTPVPLRPSGPGHTAPSPMGLTPMLHEIGRDAALTVLSEVVMRQLGVSEEVRMPANLAFVHGTNTMLHKAGILSVKPTVAAMAEGFCYMMPAMIAANTVLNPVINNFAEQHDIAALKAGTTGNAIAVAVSAGAAGGSPFYTLNHFAPQVLASTGGKMAIKGLGAVGGAMLIHDRVAEGMEKIGVSQETRSGQAASWSTSLVAGHFVNQGIMAAGRVATTIGAEALAGLAGTQATAAGVGTAAAGVTAPAWGTVAAAAAVTVAVVGAGWIYSQKQETALQQTRLAKVGETANQKRERQMANRYIQKQNSLAQMKEDALKQGMIYNEQTGRTEKLDVVRGSLAQWFFA